MTAAVSLESALVAQIESLVAAGYPALAGESPEKFRSRFDFLPEALAPHAAGLQDGGSAEDGRVPLAVVVTRELVDPESRVPLLRLEGGGQPGILDRNHFSDARPGLAPYHPLPTLDLPPGPVYALVGVERGDEYRDRRPQEAVDEVLARGRSPLSIDEGISLAATHPGILRKNHCFMLGGSSRGDQRMPALWIAEGAPKLGWCFQRTPHSWLGLASTAVRVGAAA